MTELNGATIRKLLEDEILPDYVSPSQILMYAKCPEQFRRRYIEKDKIAPAAAAHRGGSVHKAAEENFEQKINTQEDLKAQDLIDLSVAEYDRRIGEEGVSVRPGENEKDEIDKARDQTARAAFVLAEDVVNQYIPQAVELTVRVDLGEGRRDLMGVLDVVDVNGTIPDFKTSAKKKSQRDADDSLQLTAYSVLHHAAFGKAPTALVIENIVTTDTKEYRNPLTTKRDQADIMALGARINAVEKGIALGSFPPADPGAWWCSRDWCGYYTTCPFVNGKRSQGD